MKRGRIIKAEGLCCILAVLLVFVFCNQSVFADSDTEIYQPLINEYSKAVDGQKVDTSILKPSKSGIGDPTAGGCYWKKDHLIFPKPDEYYSTYRPDLAYSFYDINHDGRKELIICYKKHSGIESLNKLSKNISLVSIWTNYGGKIIPVTHSEYRSYFMILKGGLICDFLSLGAYTNSFSYSKITPQGKYKYLFTTTEDWGKYSLYKPTYRNRQEKRISKSKFKKLQKKYYRFLDVKLNWTYIK